MVLLVAQAVSRPAMGKAWGWTRQMGRGGGNQADIAGNVPDLRTRRLLHRVDKRRQPAAVDAARPAKS
ncbi:hypothetical protein JCM18382A_51160 [Bradyrhizobium sp. 17-4]